MFENGLGDESDKVYDDKSEYTVVTCLWKKKTESWASVTNEKKIIVDLKNLFGR